jgi:Aerotolerance regulator N-terminal/von Willebrand factor type A domain
MSFLAPLFLGALAALAVPVLIHLIQREKKQIVRFPSLMFLEKIPYKSVQRRQIHNWMLLLLRMAAIVLIVVAFARPFLSGTTLASPGAAGAREVVILVDRSYSMGYGDRWQRAQAEARQVVNGLAAGDRASLVFFGRGTDVQARSTEDRAQLLAAIDRAEVGADSTRYPPALKVAQSILNQSQRPRREAVLISDFQKAGWEGAQDARIPAGATLTPVPITDASTANVTVSSVAFQRGQFSGQERATVTAGLQNKSDKPVVGLEVTLDLDGRSVQSQQVSIEANASGSVTFQPFLVSGPATRGAVRTAKDALARDDAFFFTLAPGRPVPILIVERPGAGRDLSFYLARALAIGRAPAFKVDVKPLDRVDASDLNSHAVVVLNDVPLSGGGLQDRLKAFVEKGGGLFAVLGDRSTWPDTSMMPGVIGPPVDRGLGRTGSVGYLDFSHPVFELFRAPRSGNFADTRVFRYRGLDVKDPARVLARFDDGAVALAETGAGRGRILVWTTTLDNLWSDLVLKPVFLPFLHRVVTYLSQYQEPQPWLTVGQVFTEKNAGPARVALSPSGQRLPVRGSGGASGAAPGRVATGVGAEGLLELDEQGFYEVRDAGGGGRVETVAVNVDTAESDLAPLDPQELVAAVTGQALGSDPNVTDPNMELRPADIERRQAIWWYLLLAGVLLLAGETLLSNRLSRATT